GLHDWQVASAKLQRDAERAAANEGGRKTMALFQKEWGTSFGDRNEQLNAAFKHYAGSDASSFSQMRLSTGEWLRDRQEFIRLLDNLRKGAAAPPTTSKQDAQEEIDRIRAAAERDGIVPGHPKWHLVDAQLTPLYQQVHGTKRLRTDGLKDWD